MYKSFIFMRFSTILTALFCPYIAHERTAQNQILSVRSLHFALCLKERHRSQNQGSLKSERVISKSDVPSSVYRSRADRSEQDFVSSLRALRSLSQGASSLPKSRFAQERRAKERFQRAQIVGVLLAKKLNCFSQMQKNFASDVIAHALPLFGSCKVGTTKSPKKPRGN